MPSSLLTIPNLTLDDVDLSAEAQKIATDAAQPVKDWIEKSVNALAAKAAADVQKAADALQTDIANVDKLFAATQERYTAMQNDFKQLQTTFDNDALKAAAGKLTQATDAASKELADLRQKFQDGGKLAGQSAINALKTAFL